MGVYNSIPFFKTHKFKVFVTFILFNVMLSTGFGVSVFLQMDTEFTQIKEYQVVQEVETYQKALRDGQKPELSRTHFYTVYDDLKKIPESYQNAVRDLPDGEYHADGDGNVGGPEHASYTIVSLPEEEIRLYFIYTPDEIELEIEHNKKIKRIFIIGFLVALALSISGAYLLSHMLVRPIDRLLEQLRHSKPESLPVDFSKEYTQDEVGALAEALDETNQRICAFIEREKQFTRDASHELRTPVAVLKGALELIQDFPSEPRQTLSKPLGRIGRATAEMESLIESLLQRAKGDVTQERTPFYAHALVDRIVDECRYLVEGKEVTLSLSSTADPLLALPKSDFKMAVSNLIRNACNYTPEGHINVTLTETYLEVEDTGPGISDEIIHHITDPYVKGEESKGHGIGLAIVKRVCDEAGWTLRIKNGERGVCITMLFAKHP